FLLLLASALHKVRAGRRFSLLRSEVEVLLKNGDAILAEMDRRQNALDAGAATANVYMPSMH
ncbi:MAG: hypothetical protein CYPHOPRED_004871, partial [Cyphobasidiales sp. Tagirdzhanova-0007]